MSHKYRSSYAISGVPTPDIAFFALSVITWLVVSGRAFGLRARSALALPTKAGARPPMADRRRGSELAFCAKMGSSVGVKGYQDIFFMLLNY